MSKLEVPPPDPYLNTGSNAPTRFNSPTPPDSAPTSDSIPAGDPIIFDSVAPGSVAPGFSSAPSAAAATPQSRPSATRPTSFDTPSLLNTDQTQLVTNLVNQVAGVVVGEPTPIRLAVAAFLASGHVLLEDIPGVGKTVLAKALAMSIGGSFGRVQGTADLLPSDLTGVSVYDDDTKSWTFRPGPLFHSVALVDELNRATPRTQSALLEAMAERQVTVDGTTHPLPDPFFVIATQNPQGDLGTFPLVAGQRDRFSVSLSLGLPGRSAEMALLSGTGGEPALAALRPVAALADWVEVRHRVDEVFVHELVLTYALDVIDAIRTRAGATQPLSTRASLMLLRVARAYALVDGRDHVSPNDIQTVAPSALAHRIIDATNGDLPTARRWVYDLLGHVQVPPTPGNSTERPLRRADL